MTVMLIFGEGTVFALPLSCLPSKMPPMSLKVAMPLLVVVFFYTAQYKEKLSLKEWSFSLRVISLHTYIHTYIQSRITLCFSVHQEIASFPSFSLGSPRRLGLLKRHTKFREGVHSETPRQRSIRFWGDLHHGGTSWGPAEGNYCSPKYRQNSGERKNKNFWQLHSFNESFSLRF